MKQARSGDPPAVRIEAGNEWAAAPIARNQTIEMPHYASLALDNGVKPREIYEIITHLAYSGWPNVPSSFMVGALDLNQRLNRPGFIGSSIP